jgi:hypothetical protein
VKTRDRRHYRDYEVDANSRVATLDDIRRKRRHNRGRHVAVAEATRVRENSDRGTDHRSVVVKRPDARNYSVARFHARQENYRFDQQRDARGALAENEDSSNYNRISREAMEQRRSRRSLAETRRRENFRTGARRNMELEHMQSRYSASYPDRGSRVVQQRYTTAVPIVASSGLDRIRGNDLRAKILAHRAYNSKRFQARRDYASKIILGRRDYDAKIILARRDYNTKTIVPRGPITPERF